MVSEGGDCGVRSENADVFIVQGMEKLFVPLNSEGFKLYLDAVHHIFFFFFLNGLNHCTTNIITLLEKAIAVSPPCVGNTSTAHELGTMASFVSIYGCCRPSAVLHVGTAMSMPEDNC